MLASAVAVAVSTTFAFVCFIFLFILITPKIIWFIFFFLSLEIIKPSFQSESENEKRDKKVNLCRSLRTVLLF